TVLASDHATTVSNIDTYDGDLQSAEAPQSGARELADEIDISRGDLSVRTGAEASAGKEFEATLCWLHESTLSAGRRYWLKHTTRTVKAIVTELRDRLDINSGERIAAPPELRMNDIGVVKVKVQQALAFDPYAQERATGSFILVDEATNNTVAAGMIASHAA